MSRTEQEKQADRIAAAEATERADTDRQLLVLMGGQGASGDMAGALRKSRGVAKARRADLAHRRQLRSAVEEPRASHFDEEAAPAEAAPAGADLQAQQQAQQQAQAQAAAPTESGDVADVIEDA